MTKLDYLVGALVMAIFAGLAWIALGFIFLAGNLAAEHVRWLNSAYVKQVERLMPKHEKK